MPQHRGPHAAPFRAIRSVVLAALALCSMLAVGCSNVGQPDAELLPADTVRAETPAVAQRIGVLPLVIDDDFTAWMERTNKGAEPQRVFLPDDQMRREVIEKVVDALDKTGACEKVIYRPGAEGRDMAVVLRDAWNDGLDIVIRPVLRKRDCMHIGSTGIHVPGILMWFLVFPVSTWWLADEKFASQTVFGLEFWRTSAGPEAGPVATADVTGRIERDLDDFDQGFNLFNIFITPGGMSDGAWNDVGKKLLPLSMQAAQREWIARTREAEREDSVAKLLDSKSAQLHKMLAVMCGVTPPGQREPRFAAQDVQSLRRALQRNGKPLVPQRAMRTIDGARASREEFLAALKEIGGDHARQGDRLVLFLSMSGVVDGNGKSWLMMADSRRADLATTALSLADLAAELGKLPATVAVIATVAWDSVGSPVKDPWTELTDAGILVWSATAPDSVDPPLELEQLPGSMFIDEVGAAFRRERELDADGDGWLSFRELANAVAAPVQEMSRMEGLDQTPTLLGPEALQTAPFFPLASEDDEPVAPGGDGTGDGTPSDAGTPTDG
ncbi:MAG: hypothetical protein AB7K09_01290 [Planctomycetota bacterium]